MSMKSLSSPRRLYVRNGCPLVLYGGLVFAPARGKSAIDVDQPVRIEPAKRDHGRARVTVVQGATQERWNESHG